MKGQSTELIELLILIVGASVLILISYFLFSAKFPQISSSIAERHKYEMVTDVTKNFLYTRIPEIDKTYGQMLGDMIVNGGEDIVEYGERYGGINVTKIVYEYFDKYFPERWSLNISARVQITHILWIPNSGAGNSVSKISTVDGNEMGQYYTVGSGNGDPSRVSLDSKGNVWVGNRGERSVVKIGLAEKDQCIDRNGDGVIETSKDFNENGIIDANEILPFNMDECLLANVPLGGGGRGGALDWKGIRAVCVDRQDNVYAGLWSDQRLFYISSNGRVEKEWYLPNYLPDPRFYPYGCFVDQKTGIVWISSAGTNHPEYPGLVKFNPQTETFTEINLGYYVYGIAPCSTEDCLVINAWNSQRLAKLNTTSNSVIFDIPKTELKDGRGIITDEEDNIYAVSSANRLVVKYDKNGNEIKRASTCLEPRGLGIDAVGKIWVTCKDSDVWRFDKNLTLEIISHFGTDHYVYNFFTSTNVPPIEIGKYVNFGYKCEDPSKITTFVAPLPIPSYKGNVVRFEFKTW